MSARHRHSGNSHAHRLVFSFAWRSHARTLAIPRYAAIIVFAVIPIITVIYLAATCYFIFHDDLFASLMQREADMQYAYEDRIAALLGNGLSKRYARLLSIDVMQDETIKANEAAR